ncbi:hypothetical protein [Ochrobactrum soli]|uniref:Uncharacterized protein n=1 Tax=Ochrobactrum soli TaxID=2448455 RepID=A0A2P9HF55_9HYPH|nr:hypothetical protein [[Ochrobactrum] soli]SPL62734.1 hypothetical protein OHAE_5341 [[Ochrobactrum] soli]
MAADVIALGIEVRITVPVKLWPVVDLAFCAASTFLTYPAVAIPLPSFIVGTRTLYNNNILKLATCCFFVKPTK